MKTIIFELLAVGVIVAVKPVSTCPPSET